MPTIESIPIITANIIGCSCIKYITEVYTNFNKKYKSGTKNKKNQNETLNASKNIQTIVMNDKIPILILNI